MRRASPFLLLLLVGCGGPKKAAVVPLVSPAPLSPWTLTTLDGRDPEPAYLSNGLLGVRVGRNASGLGPDGKPLGFFMIDEYEPKGEEKIRPLPNPLLVTLAVGNKTYQGGDDYDFLKSGGTPLDPRGGTDYRQMLDMRTGVLKTFWTQAGMNVSCFTVVHPATRALGQRWTLTASKATTFSVRTLDYAGPTDPQVAIGQDDSVGVAISASPRRVVALRFKAKGGTLGAAAAIDGLRVQEGSLKAGETLTYERCLAFGPLSSMPIKVTDDATVQRLSPKALGFDEIERASEAAWKKRWQSDIEIDGPVEDQQAVRSFLFYLRSSIAPDARRAIAPMALSSEIYGGHVFWDADIWVFPALMLTDPDLAAQISAYRLDRVAAAERNYKEWIEADRPTAVGKMGPTPISAIFGLKFPWESSVTGWETVPGPSRFEDHITGSVLWSLTQAEALNIFQTRSVVAAPSGGASSSHSSYKDAAVGAADFYRERTVIEQSVRQIKGTMSPDENHIGDNDLYTNLLAMWLTSGRKWPATPTYKLPKDDKSFLTYDGDPVKGYKQAAAILACYPLQYPPAEAQTRTMLERFGPKTNANGPAMTDAIEGLLWARIAQPDKGYEAWRKGWVDFTRHPLMMFSEKRKSARTYFATGAGGALQTVLYGFAGLRLDYGKATGARWSRPISGGKMLSVKPSLPKRWKRVRLKGIALPDGRYDFDITSGGVSVAKVR